MDLSLSSDWGNVAYKLFRKAFVNIDKTWDTVLKLNCKRAFTRQVIVDSSMCFQFKHGLASGIPGTTKFDEVASATVNGFLQELFELEMAAVHDHNDLAQWLAGKGEAVTQQFGLVFKEGSFVLSKFVPDQPSYGFEFLGQTLVRVSGKERTHYVPKPSLTKLMISSTTYKKSYKSPLIKQKCAMSKFRSLYAGGGYLHPLFAGRLSTIYSSMASRNIRPMGEDDAGFVDESETSKFVEIVFAEDDYSFPTLEWCLNLYLPYDDQLEEGSAITLAERLNSEPSEIGRRDEPDFDLTALGLLRTQRVNR